jgi:hypothetical protein
MRKGSAYVLCVTRELNREGGEARYAAASTVPEFIAPFYDKIADRLSQVRVEPFEVAGSGFVQLDPFDVVPAAIVILFGAGSYPALWAISPRGSKQA